MSNAMLRGRQLVLYLINKSGDAVAEGDLVIVAPTVGGAFTTTDSAAKSDCIFAIAQEAIANDAAGKVLLSGQATKVNLNSAASLGDFLFSHSVAKLATPDNARGEGALGQVIGTGTAPAAIIWGVPDAASGVAGGDITTDTAWTALGDLIVGVDTDEAAILSVGTDGQQLQADSGEATGLKWVTAQRYLTFNVAGVLTTQTGTTRLKLPFACTIVGVEAVVGVAPTGASLIVDLHKNGTTIFTTQAERPTIVASAYDDTATPDVTALAAGDYLTLDIDQIGSTVAGSNLVVTITVSVP